MNNFGRALQDARDETSWAEDADNIYNTINPSSMTDYLNDMQTAYAELEAERDKLRDLLHDLETTDVTIAVQEREEAREQARALLEERGQLKAERGKLHRLVQAFSDGIEAEWLKVERPASPTGMVFSALRTFWRTLAAEVEALGATAEEAEADDT